MCKTKKNFIYLWRIPFRREVGRFFLWTVYNSSLQQISCRIPVTAYDLSSRIENILHLIFVFLLVYRLHRRSFGYFETVHANATSSGKRLVDESFWLSAVHRRRRRRLGLYNDDVNDNENYNHSETVECTQWVSPRHRYFAIPRGRFGGDDDYKNISSFIWACVHAYKC